MSIPLEQSENKAGKTPDFPPATRNSGEEKNSPASLSEPKAPKATFGKLTPQEAGRKGGSVKTSESQSKRVHLKLVNIKWCSSKCPIYPCAFATASHAKYQGECALKKLPYEMQDTVMQLYLNGIDGVHHEAIRVLTTLATKTTLGTSRKEQRDYLRDLQIFKEMFYGKNLHVEGNMHNDGVLTFDVIRSALLEHFEKKSQSAAESSPQQETASGKPDRESEEERADHPG